MFTGMAAADGGGMARISVVKVTDEDNDATRGRQLSFCVWYYA